MDMLTAKDLEVTYDGTCALKGSSINLQAGTITVLLGASGSGKSTLLNSVAGLHPLNGGSVWVNGEDLHKLDGKKRAAQIAFVAQDYQLFPHMTVLNNVTHPMRKVLGVSLDKAVEQARDVLKKLNIEHLENRYPHQLSGGQKQRVAIARSLSMGSKLLLLDEPTSALDPYSSEVLAQLLKDLALEGFTILLSTHDMEFAVSTMDTAVFLQNGSITGVTTTADMNTLKSYIESFPRSD